MTHFKEINDHDVDIVSGPHCTSPLVLPVSSFTSLFTWCVA